ncbi:MAG: transcriptional regulator, partial [Mesorhizobium sp.]
LEDGKKFKSLKRHLDVHYGLTPDEYREKWGLKSEYPMVAPNYAAQRSSLAKAAGLGRKTPVKAVNRAAAKTRANGRGRA